jgi:hypothetical protein
MKPHKHADLIKAWADGAEIEWKDRDGFWEVGEPSWNVDSEYRIKPIKSNVEILLESAIQQLRGRYLSMEEETLVAILRSYRAPA